jgi:hypothetical protein
MHYWVAENLLFKFFYHLPPVSTTPVVHLEPQFFFEKDCNCTIGINSGSGEDDSWNIPAETNLLTLVILRKKLDAGHQF